MEHFPMNWDWWIYFLLGTGIKNHVWISHVLCDWIKSTKPWVKEHHHYYQAPENPAFGSLCIYYMYLKDTAAL